MRRASEIAMGFLIAVALVGSVSTLGAYLVGQGMVNASSHGSEGFFSGLGGPFAFFMALVSTIIVITTTMVVVVHKTFNLVTWLPENVIRWAGGQGDSLGEQSDERRVAGVFASVGSNMGQGIANRPGSAPGGGNNDESGDESGGKDGGNDQASQAKKGSDDRPEIADDSGSNGNTR